jgi:hypothetical protein
MHISLSLPNPIARLTRILVAVEQRRGGAPPACDEYEALDSCAMTRRETSADFAEDLEGMSLSHFGPPPEPECDELDLLSLSSDESNLTGHHDGLDDLSLTRSFPPRPGP